MMKIDEIISDINKKKTVRDKIAEARKIKEESNDEFVHLAINTYLDKLKMEIVTILEGIKNSDDESFEKLLKIKDIKNFIHYYAYQICEYHVRRYKLDDIVSEIKFQLFYHIKKNYRIYYEVDELSLLINSMRQWIKFKTSDALKTVYKPKKLEEDYLPELFIEDMSYDGSHIEIMELAEQLLEEKYLTVFKLRLNEDLTFEAIGEIIGMSVDTSKRRWDKSLEIFKDYYESKLID